MLIDFLHSCKYIVIFYSRDSLLHGPHLFVSVMADYPLSSDLEPEPGPSQRPAKGSKQSSGKRSEAASRKSHKPKSSKGLDKAAQRCHNALECQWDRARHEAAAAVGLGSGAPSDCASLTVPDLPASPGSPASSTGPVNREDASGTTPPRLSRRVSQSLPDVSVVGLAPSRRPPRTAPEATFTPMAAGLCDPQEPHIAPPLDLQTFLSSAFSFLAAGFNQAAQPFQHTWSGSPPESD